MKKPVKLRISVDTTEVTSDYVFDTIFKISDKSTDEDKKASQFASIAKDLVTEAAKRAPDGLFVEDWKDVSEKYKLSKHQYFYILRKLKNVGLLEKHRGKYYLIRKFNEHLMEMATSMQKYFMGLGVTKTWEKPEK